MVEAEGLNVKLCLIGWSGISTSYANGGKKVKKSVALNSKAVYCVGVIGNGYLDPGGQG